MLQEHNVYPAGRTGCAMRKGIDAPSNRFAALVVWSAKEGQVRTVPSLVHFSGGLFGPSLRDLGLRSLARQAAARMRLRASSWIWWQDVQSVNNARCEVRVELQQSSSPRKRQCFFSVSTEPKGFAFQVRRHTCSGLRECNGRSQQPPTPHKSGLAVCHEAR
jgi:hypothetical protein